MIRGLFRFALFWVLAGAGTLVFAQSPADGFGLGPITLPRNSQIVSLFDVVFEVTGTTGDSTQDAEILQQARERVAIGPNEAYNQIVADAAAMRLRRIPGVRTATYRLQLRINPNGVTLVFTLTLAKPGYQEGRSEGFFARGESGSLPLLYRDEKSILTLMLNGGDGVFRDGQPWFGVPLTFTRNNPLVPNPPLGAQTGSSAAWTENYVEFGIGGSTQLGDSPYYLYGAASAIGVMAAGQDIFWNGARWQDSIEKLYAGLLWAGPSGGTANISVGRQNFSLNDGFLISQFGSQYNAGPRPGVYLAPHTTQDFSVLAQGQWNGWTVKGFFLDPNEYEPIETNTKVLGANLRYNATASTYADASVITVPSSDSVYRDPSGIALPRAGLVTYAGHVRWADPAVAPGVWLESEMAYQNNINFPMSAWAGYGTLGYLASKAPWSPSLSYRYSSFSGDNPNTSTYERFDPLFSGGLAEWLQGISFGKVLSQTNRTTHRVRFNVSPVAELNLTLDYYSNWANQLNNIGANPALSQLSSKNLGQEVQLVARWAINKNFYLMGIASYAMPGPAIQDATNNTAKPWSTLQLQLFWNW